MIGNARVARNKECCPTGFQLAPFPAFVVLIYGHTWQWRVTPRQSIRSAIELCLFEKKNKRKKKKKKEREKKRMERGGKKRKEKKRKARYVDTWRVVSFYDRYRCINGPRIETQRTATRDFCCVQERKGEKKEEEDVEKGLLPTGRNMNSRLTYFFSYVENYGETYKFTWRCYSSLFLFINLHKIYQKELLLYRRYYWEKGENWRTVLC